MGKLRALAKRLPLVPDAYRFTRRGLENYRLSRMAPEAIFSDIYVQRAWNGQESVSGPGSDLHQTRTIAKAIPEILSEYKLKSILDIPCGDFNWMKTVNLEGIEYIGADIVQAIVDGNNEKYARKGVSFVKADLINDPLPDADLIFCRDCLVHLSQANIFKAFKNMRRSTAKYLLTTTFPARSENRDIPTGRWSALNLELPPFRLPKPLRAITEGSTEDNGRYADKTLALWEIAQLSETRR